MNKTVFICKQCQKLYFTSDVRRVVTEQVKSYLDKEGHEHILNGETHDVVQVMFMCPKQFHHDFYKITIPETIYLNLYLKWLSGKVSINMIDARYTEGIPFKVKIEDTAYTLNQMYSEEQILERLFESSL